MLPSREVRVFTAIDTKRAARALPLAAFAQPRLPRLANRLLWIMLAFLGLGPALSLHSQSVVYMGALQQVVTSSTAGSANSMAIDSQGDIWVVDPGSLGLAEFAAVNGVVPSSATPVLVASNKFTAPWALAFDAAGDLFVSDTSTAKVYEVVAVGGLIPTSGSLTINAVASGFQSPEGLAFDASGDLWVADTGHNAIKEIVAVSGSIPASPTINTVGSGFSLPSGVAVDSAGDVFVADSNNSAVKEMVGVAPPTASTPPASPTIRVLGSGFTYPYGVALDAQGDVFVADTDLDEIVAVGGSIPTSNAVTLNVAIGTTVARAVTGDAHNNIYFTQYFNPSSELVISELAPANFGQVQAGQGSGTSTLPTSKTLTLVFGFLKNPDLSEMPVVYTQGATGQDFQDAGTGTCTLHDSVSYSDWEPGQTCTLNVTFKPLYPGKRMGAAVLTITYDATGSATAPLAGDGVAPMINFGLGTFAGPYSPSSITQVGSSNNNGYHNLAMDAKHNVYITNDNGEIDEATAASNYQTVTMIASASVPFDIVVDGAGDVIWNDFGTNSIQEAVAVNGSIPASPTIVTLASSLFLSTSSFPGLAIDGYGDIYFSDFSHFYELVAVNGAIPPSATLRTIPISKHPGPMAFDQYNNLFFEDGSNCFDKVSQFNGQIPSSPTVQQVYCGSQFVYGMAVDAAGNLWWADIGNPVNVIQAVNGVIPSSPNVVHILFTGGSLHGEGMGLDDNGNLFVSFAPNESPYIVDFYDFRDPPSFTWSGNTNVGQTGNPTNFAFAADMGNAPLTLPIPSSGTNPTINPNWTWATGATGACPNVTSGASSSGTLAVSAVCGLAISFHPTTAGSPLTGQLTFADDDLFAVNAVFPTVEPNDAMQSIMLSGNAVGQSSPTATLTPNPVAFGNQTAGTTSTAMAASLSNTGNATLTGITPSLTGTNPSDFAIGTGSNACGSSLNAGSSCSIYITFTPASAVSFTATLSVADNASSSPQTTTLTGTGTAAAAPTATLTPSPVAFGNQAAGTTSAAQMATLQNTGNATLTGITPSLTGTNPSDFAIGTGPNACGSTLAAGASCSIYVTFSPASATSFSATLSVADNAVAPGGGGGGASQLNITYFTIAEADKDGGVLCCGVSTNYVLSGLGPDGLPVYNPSSTATSGSIFAPHDQLTNNEITWWSPTFNNGGAGGVSDVVETGTAVVSLPFANNNFYAPNGTGSSDSSAFQAAILSGNLNAPTAEQISFSIASDDMAFLYLDGVNVCDDGGVHGATAVPCTTSTISAGAHSLELFYVDLDPSQAVLDFSITSSGVTTAPGSGSPQTVALTGTGIAASAPVAGLSSPTLTFTATVGSTSAAQSVLLSNTGNATLNISSIALTGTNPSDFTIGTGSNACGSTLAADASCSIYITFKPAAATGYTATLSVSDNASSSPQTTSLIGTGVSSPDFSVVADAPTSSTIEPGATANFTFTVSPLSPATTFGGAISLTVAGLPTGATYSLTPSSIASGASSTIVTLTVTTPITTLASNAPPQLPAQGARWALVVLSLLLLPLAGRFRRAGRRFSRMLSVVLLVGASLAVAAAVSGCGGIPSGYFGQAQTTSTITLTGTSGSLSHSAAVTLTVE